MNLCCVKCTSVLDKSHVGDVEVDLCPKCGGLWLDHGEVAKLALAPEEEIAPLRELLRARRGPPPVPAEDSHPCPACAGALKEVALGSIHIDYCVSCKGMFLDRGELEAAIEEVRARVKTAAARKVVAAVASATRDAAD